MTSRIRGSIPPRSAYTFNAYRSASDKLGKPYAMKEETGAKADAWLRCKKMEAPRAGVSPQNTSLPCSINTLKTSNSFK
jgi:hypothetical protein